MTLASHVLVFAVLMAFIPSVATAYCEESQNDDLVEIQSGIFGALNSSTYIHPKIIGSTPILGGATRSDLLDCKSGSVRLGNPTKAGACRPVRISKPFHEALLPALDSCVRSLVPPTNTPIQVIHWGISRAYPVPPKSDCNEPDGDFAYHWAGADPSDHTTDGAIDIHEIRVGGKSYNYMRAVEANRKAVETYVLSKLGPGETGFSPERLFALADEYYATPSSKNLEFASFWAPMQRCLMKGHELSYTSTLYQKGSEDRIVPEFVPAGDNRNYSRQARKPSDPTQEHHDHLHVALDRPSAKPIGVRCQ